jgi:HEAT repeat protein
MRTTLTVSLSCLLSLCILAAFPTHARAKDKKKKRVIYKGRTVTEWVGKLVYSKIDDKKEAMRAIKAIGVPAVPILVKNLKKRGAFYWCASALGQLGEKSVPAVPALISHLADKDQRNADKAYEVLRQIGVKSVPALIKALPKQKSFKGRVKVINLLGAFGQSAAEAIPKLAPGLSNKNPEMRQVTVRALGSMGPKAALAVVKYINHKKSYVRLSAASCLARLGASAKSAIPVLEARLKKEKKKDVKAAIQNALINIKI